MAPGHSDSSGRYTLAGLPHEARAVVDIIAANVSLGAMGEIPAVATAGAGKKEIDVRLGPLVKLSGPRSRRRRQSDSRAPSLACSVT